MRPVCTFTHLGKFGRFANGCYQIAGTIGIARRNGFDFQFPPWKNHNGRDFEPDLDIDCQKEFVNPLPLQTIPDPPEHGVAFGWHPDRINLSHSVDLRGHFQSDKYFVHAIDETRWYMTMKDEPPLNDYCAIHWRAGDYGDEPSPQHPQGNSFHPRMGRSYYDLAIAQFPKDQKFLVFSDNIDGAKQMFGESDRFSYSEGRNYFEDFRLLKRCQPVGTVVRTLDGDLPIEHLQKAQRLMSYSGCGQVYKEISKLIGRNDSVRGAPPGRAISAIGSRPFIGKLTVVKTFHGRISKYTPNHLCVVKLGDSLMNRHLVYLMRKGGYFRVGVTGPQVCPRGRKTDRAVGSSDVRSRLNGTQSDEAWILASFKDRDQALLEEKYICAKFGIPDIQFDGWFKTEAHSRRLNQFWERFGANLEGARKCLSYYGRRFEYPFCQRHVRRDLVSDKETILPACNVLDGMKVLDADRYLSIAGGKGPCEDAWDTAQVSNEDYAGLVYSMDVEVNETYVGDGLVTHNCHSFIVSNSSFSMFAAIIADQPDKKIVAPAPWFGGAYQGTLPEDDIYPAGSTIINYVTQEIKQAA